MPKEDCNARCTVCGACLTVLFPVVGICGAEREFDGGTIMTLFYLLSGVLALGLFLYLFAALLKPEWFA
jgi:K+-transporting ATPase KdpF subunit